MAVAKRDRGNESIMQVFLQSILKMLSSQVTSRGTRQMHHFNS